MGPGCYLNCNSVQLMPSESHYGFLSWFENSHVNVANPPFHPVSVHRVMKRAGDERGVHLGRKHSIKIKIEIDGRVQ